MAFLTFSASQDTDAKGNIKHFSCLKSSSSEWMSTETVMKKLKHAVSKLGERSEFQHSTKSKDDHKYLVTF